MTTAKEILQKARKLITEPGSWIQGHYAQDANGKLVDEESEDATCYCSSGALSAAACPRGQTEQELVESQPYRYRARATLEAYMDGNVIAFNDREGRTHEQVLAAFDKAIELVEEPK